MQLVSSPVPGLFLTIFHCLEKFSKTVADYLLAMLQTIVILYLSNDRPVYTSDELLSIYNCVALRWDYVSMALKYPPQLCLQE
jgi:hypothetical protein